MWNLRMLLREGDVRYADIMELALYNGIISGWSLDGNRYFYQNPLADDGTHRRSEWFGTACCPPNIARTLASLPGYFYSTSEDGAWVHFYADNEADLELPGGEQVKIAQSTDYPWNGKVRITVDGEGKFAVMLRVPGWCNDGAKISVNGIKQKAGKPGSYAVLNRKWKSGDEIEIKFPMPVRLIESHPYATENTGRVAVARGPFIYCLEETDNKGFDIRDVIISRDIEFDVKERPDLLDGVVILKGKALMTTGSCWAGKLYGSPPQAEKQSGLKKTKITAIPYYAWANRKPGRMHVWLRSR